MNRNYYLSDTGELLEIKDWVKDQEKLLVNSDGSSEILEKNVKSLGKSILKRKLTDNYTLLINSFRNCVMVLSTETVNLLSSNIDALSVEERIFFVENLRTDLEWLRERNKKESGQEYLKSWAVSLSYACNMRCAYCFQQCDKNLDQSQMTQAKLNKILECIKKELVADEKSKKKCFRGRIEIFGGEPLLFGNRELISKVFEFCEEQNLRTLVTTNGYCVDTYIKELSRYRSLISEVGITLDGGEECHNLRRVLKNNKGSFKKIINNINLLIKHRIPVVVYINLDPTNVDEFKTFLKIAEENNWINRDGVELAANRVHNRLYDSGYEHKFLEGELLERLLLMRAEQNFPENFRITFLRSIFDICKKLNITFGQIQSRFSGHFCWATSSNCQALYTDSSHDVYCCPYAVSRKKYLLGKIDNDLEIKRNSKIWHSHNIFELKECQNCVLGGYCNGGCFLSYREDKKRQCKEERENFHYFVERVLAPILKSKLNKEVKDVMWNKMPARA